LSSSLLPAAPRPWLVERARRTPDADALVIGAARYSYGELAARARRAAGALRRAGMAAGDRVACLLESGLDAVVLLHALDLCGATALPLSARLTPQELGFELEDADAAYLVHGDGDLRNQALAAATANEALRARVRPLAAADLLHGRAGPSTADAPLRGPDVEPNASSPLALLYTSGTSGRPKAVSLSHANFHASALASAQLLGAHPADRWLACMPLHHVGGLSILVRSVLAGSCVLLHGRFDPRAVSRAIDEDGATVVSLVATMLKRLLDVRDGRRAPKTLRCVLVGGGPTPPALLERALALGFPVAPTYGLTEACSQVATRVLYWTGRQGVLRGTGRQGVLGGKALSLDGQLRPLPGVVLRIEDERGRVLPAGEVGEICVRGPIVMEGYVARPEATAEALRGGWLHTGDAGALADDGSLRVVDRRVDLIVSGGENVYPAEVEAVLREHPGVAEVAVVATGDEEFGQRPLACFVPSGASPPRDEELRRFCRTRLAGYKVPVAFRALAELPRSGSGKLLRRVLREAQAKPG